MNRALLLKNKKEKERHQCEDSLDSTFDWVLVSAVNGKFFRIDTALIEAYE